MSPPPPHECGAPTAGSSDTSDTSPTACSARAVVNAACDVERAGLDRAYDESGACPCAQCGNPATSAGTDIRAITSNNTIRGSNESHTCDMEDCQEEEEEEEGKAVGREDYWRTEESRHDNCTTVTDAFEAAIEDCLAHCVVASRPVPPHISSLHCTHRKVGMDGWGACHTSCDLKTTKDTPETLTCRTCEASCEAITRSSCNVRPTDEHDGKVEEVEKMRVAPITRSTSRHLDDSATRRVTGDTLVRTRKGEADLQHGRRRDIGRRCIGKARTQAMRDGKVRRALLRIWPPSLRDTALQHYYRVFKEEEEEEEGGDDCTRCDRCYGANVKKAASERVATPLCASRTVNGANAATPRNEVDDTESGQGGGATEACAVAELLRGICEDKMYLFATSRIIAARDVRQTRSVRQSAKVRRTSTPTCCVHRSSSNDSGSDSSRDKGKSHYNTANAISSSVTEQRDLTRRRPSLTSQSATDATLTTTFTRGMYVSSNATGSSRGITESHKASNDNANDDDGEVKAVRVVAAGHKQGEHSGPVHTSCTSHTCVPLVFRPAHWYTSSNGSRLRRHTRLDTLSSNDDDSDSDGKEIPVHSFRSAAPLRGMTAPLSSAASAAAPLMSSSMSSSSSLLSQGPSAAVRALGWFHSEQERQRMARHIMSSGKLRHECPEVFALLCARATEARATHPDCDPSQQPQ